MKASWWFSRIVKTFLTDKIFRIRNGLCIINQWPECVSWHLSVQVWTWLACVLLQTMYAHTHTNVYLLCFSARMIKYDLYYNMAWIKTCLRNKEKQTVRIFGDWFWHFMQVHGPSGLLPTATKLASNSTHSSHSEELSWTSAVVNWRIMFYIHLKYLRLFLKKASADYDIYQ